MDVMIAMAIVSVLLVGLSNFLLLQTQQASSLDIVNEERMLASEMSLALVQSASCGATLQGLNPVATGSATVNQIRFQPTAGPAQVLYSIGDAYGSKLRIADMQLTNFRMVSDLSGSGFRQGLADLVITTNRVVAPPGLGNTGTQTLNVLVSLDAANQVGDCNSDSKSDLQSFCDTVGGDFVNPSCEDLEITGTLTVGNNLKADFISTPGLFTANQEVNVKGKNEVNTGPLTTQQLDIKGDLDMETLFVNNDALVKELGVSNAICVGANCQTFAPASCPANQYVWQVRGDGTVDCLPRP